MLGSGSDSDSENDVRVGPYTMEEAILDVTKRRRLPITHRHSCITSFKHYAAAENSSSKNVSESSYSTANDTSELHETNDFLQKLTNVINEPVSKSTSYATAYDGERSVQDEKPADVSVITISDSSSFDSEHHSSDVRPTVYCTIDQKPDLQMLNRPFLTGNLHQDVAYESSTELSQSGQTFSKDHRQRASDSSENMERIQDNELLVGEKVQLNLMENCKPDAVTLESESSNDEASSSGNDTREIETISDFDNTKNTNNQKSAHNTIYGLQEDLSNVGNNNHRSASLQLDASASSELEESLASFHLESDDSSNSTSYDTSTQYVGTKQNSDDNRLSDYLTLDDTMEELNQFIEQGPDYVMSPKPRKPVTASSDWMPLGRNTSASTSSDSCTSSLSSNTGNQVFKSRLPTPTTMGHKKKNTCSAEKIGINRVEKSGMKPGASVKSSSKALFDASPYKSDFDFKVPDKPVSSRTPKPNLSNVVSPVGIYIKYSPRYCPLVKVPTLPDKPIRTNLFEQKPSSKVAIPAASNCEIPPVIYKQAPTRLVSEAQDVNLPNSIQKLISPRVVTKHERRIERHQHDLSIERRLLESDISINDNDSRDISIVVNKQPFDVRKF